jgi:hypothetical protein
MSLFDPSKLSSFDIPADVITTANIAIDKLRNRLVDQIDASCIFPGIIVRWSSQMFLQGQVRRSLMFIEGGYDAFLSGRVSSPLHALAQSTRHLPAYSISVKNLQNTFKAVILKRLSHSYMQEGFLPG